MPTRQIFLCACDAIIVIRGDESAGGEICVPVTEC
jgi:hypothetical protein